MAYQSSDGQKFTNRPPMKAHERSMAAKAPAAESDPLAQPAEHEGGDDQGMAHDQDNMEGLKQAFANVMDAVAQGERPDPQAARELVNYFSTFVNEEQQEMSEEPEYQ